MIELIGIDVDNTLFCSDSTISPRTKTAIERAARLGVKVVICTGRLPVEAQGIAKMAGCGGQSVVGCNGAYSVIAEKKREILHALPGEKSREALRLIARHGLATYAFLPKSIYTNIFDENHPQIIWWHSMLDRWHVNLCARPMEEIIETEGLLKIIAIEEEPEKLRALWEDAKKLRDIFIAPSFRNNIEITREGVDKGSALLEIAAELRIPRENIMAIGDNYNDIPMLQAAGLSVAMGNACPEAKASARHITTTNDDDGVGRAIENFVLQR